MPARSVLSPPELGAAPGQGPAWSVAQAALRVGVSTSTLRSWERRYGLRPSLRTDGGHRRYTVVDITHLQHLARLIASGMATATAAAEVRRLEQASLGDPPERSRHAVRSSTAAERFERAADTLDSAALARIAASLVQTRGVIASWTEVFAPYLIELGRRWGDTGTGVECEHIAVAVLQSVLDRHAWNRSRHSGGAAVLLTATAAESHTLPLHAVSAALAELHVGSRVLGTLPAASAVAAATRLKPAASLLWARSAQSADTDLLAELVRRVPNVCAAGQGWRARMLPATVTHTSELSSTVELLATWVR